MSDLGFRLDIRDPGRNSIAVTLEMDRTAWELPGGKDSADVVLFLPTWTGILFDPVVRVVSTSIKRNPPFGSATCPADLLSDVGGKFLWG